MQIKNLRFIDHLAGHAPVNHKIGAIDKIVSLGSQVKAGPDNALGLAHPPGLVTRETRTLGLIIPDITNPFFPEVARGVEDAASQAGYNCRVCRNKPNHRCSANRPWVKWRPKLLEEIKELN